MSPITAIHRLFTHLNSCMQLELSYSPGSLFHSWTRVWQWHSGPLPACRLPVVHALSLHPPLSFFSFFSFFLLSFSSLLNWWTLFLLLSSPASTWGRETTWRSLRALAAHVYKRHMRYAHTHSLTRRCIHCLLSSFHFKLISDTSHRSAARL